MFHDTKDTATANAFNGSESTISIVLINVHCNAAIL